MSRLFHVEWIEAGQWRVTWQHVQQLSHRCNSGHRHLAVRSLRSVCRHRWQLPVLHTPTDYMLLPDTRLTTLFPGPPRWAGTRKVKPIWTLLEQETVSSSGISWAVCKSAPRSRQTTTPAPHHSVFYRPDALPAAQPTAWKHWRHCCYHTGTTHKQNPSHRYSNNH